MITGSKRCRRITKKYHKRLDELTQAFDKETQTLLSEVDVNNIAYGTIAAFVMFRNARSKSIRQYYRRQKELRKQVNKSYCKCRKS